MSDADTMISVGAALLDFGFLSAAKQCLTHAHKLSPKDLRAAVFFGLLRKRSRRPCGGYQTARHTTKTPPKSRRYP